MMKICQHSLLFSVEWKSSLLIHAFCLLGKLLQNPCGCRLADSQVDWKTGRLTNSKVHFFEQGADMSQVHTGYKYKRRMRASPSLAFSHPSATSPSKLAPPKLCFIPPYTRDWLWLRLHISQVKEQTTRKWGSVRRSGHETVGVQVPLIYVYFCSSKTV